LALLLMASPGRAAASFLASPEWMWDTGFGCFQFCGLGDGAASKEEIWATAEAYFNENSPGSFCGWIDGGSLFSGEYPNETWRRQFLTADQCRPELLTPWNVFAIQQGLPSLTCPSNSTLSGSTCTCGTDFTEANGTCSGGKDNGFGGPGTVCVGNPCNPANGNKVEQQVIYRGPNGFELTLTFNTFDDFAPRFGRHWRDSFDRRVLVDGANVIVYRPDGKALRFVPSGGAWATDGDTSDRLTELENPPGTRIGWELLVASGDELEIYDAPGKLLTIRSRSGLTQTFVYSDGTGGPNGGFVLDAMGIRRPPRCLRGC
jgi:hypothetical protein